ncbi:MAG TPA: bifunctional DNA-formamidopyrimidine glycosylase/DNA-(apurinic or apyrimidinic site) lyase [Rhodospirillales bacterium]|jgi:formamidopyrimidine-DNA glycosylase|nr:bifunctional DNA-formamidopyrimidine glycosylase/DNA-(apurinic or apyrimidinic site) lyase [Rhodospirillales bacterium]
MPELPEVETVRLGLAPVLEGRLLSRVLQRRADLRFPLPVGFARCLTGRRILALGRRGKFILATLDDGWVLILHLGMSGRFKVFMGPPPAEDVHDHVTFETDAGATIRFSDPRRFGFMDLVPEAELAFFPSLSGLGPEPLSAEFGVAWLESCLNGRKTPIKTAIMDQAVVAGMGNIYASESLFRAGISPKRKAASVKGQRARHLAAAIREVLVEAIKVGGSSLRDHRLPDGGFGYFQHRFAVYGRQGLACPGCDCEIAKTAGVRRIVQAGRATFYCSSRQR